MLKIPFYKRSEIWICLLLISLTLSIFFQIQNHEFINYDDDKFISENHYVQSGLTSESVRWAFQKGWGYWKPFTWLSLMLDVEIHGMNPGGFLLTNLLLHISNSLLLFFLFKRMTGTVLKSSIVAALFAVHPLHVESVAWVVERKDVLSTFFWLLTTWSYVNYIKHPKFIRYLPIALFMCLGLMTKPMLVTLPFTLLLLDYWPLGRIKLVLQEEELKPNFSEGSKFGNKIQQPLFLSVMRLLIEKIPLFTLSFFFSFIVLSHKIKKSIELAGAVEDTDFYLKMINSVNAYAAYIGKTFWPFNLATPYLLKEIPLQQMTVAILVLLMISFYALKTCKQRPYFIMGWIWFLFTLIPVIGIIRMGPFSMADRFTYVPLIGIFIIIAWGLYDLFENMKHKLIVIVMLSSLFILTLTVNAWVQTSYWKNTITLFQHTIHVTSDNYVAHNNLGSELKSKNNTHAAIEHFKKAVSINPDYYISLNNLGVTLETIGETDLAAAYYQKALTINPNLAAAYFNLGTLMENKGKIDQAIKHISEAVRLKPDFAEGRTRLNNLKKFKDEIEVEIKKNNLQLESDPRNPFIHYRLGFLNKQIYKLDKAYDHFKEALSVKPDFPQALKELALIYAQKKKYSQAIRTLHEAVRLQPKNSSLYYNIACLYSVQNKTGQSIEWLEKAFDKGYRNRERLINDEDLKNVRSAPEFRKLMARIENE